MRTVLLAFLALGWSASQSIAEIAYPERPVTLIVPFAAGGASDSIARAVAEELRDILGRPFIVENRTGADGILGLEIAHRAAPDGYTLLVGNGVSNGSTPVFDKGKISFDVDTAFDIVAPLAEGPPTILTSSTTLPVRNVDELVSYVKENPGKIRFGSAGIGSSSHLDLAKLSRQQGLSMVHLPSVGGGGELLYELISGDIHISFVNASTAAPYIRSGKLNGLAVVGEKRLEGLDVPTFAEQGYPQIGILLWHALFAPAKVPDAIKQALFTAVQSALKRPKVQTLFKSFYFIPVNVETREDANAWHNAARAEIRDLINETPPAELNGSDGEGR